MRRSIVVELDEILIERIRRIATQEDIAFDRALERMLANHATLKAKPQNARSRKGL